MLTQELLDQGFIALRAFVVAGLRLAPAESCTGGLVAAAITSWSGSAAVLERGFVTYSNEAKAEMLGVSAALIAREGAVSREVAVAMATGALVHSHADISVAITGIAGPTGGSAEKPVGLVYIAAADRRNGRIEYARHIFPGDRGAVRTASALAALAMAISLLPPDAVATTPLPVPRG